ncbi:hypothetical protein HUU61_20320 [Rhodopseudomonas palustris]|nr:hypothetical protein [Rhodopseudomonas palustris]
MAGRMPGRNSSRDRRRPRGVVIALLAGLVAGPGLGGCSISLSDMPLMGSSEKVEKPKETEAFPAVNDLPANRGEAVLAPAERNKIEQELIAARERQANANGSAAAKPGATPSSAAK